MKWKAYKQGRKDCKNVDGEMRGYENRYPEDSEEHISYRRGWNEYWNENWKKHTQNG